MKKKTKKALAMSISTLVVGGIAAGVAIPVVNLNNKVNYYGWKKDLKDESVIAGGLTRKDIDTRAKEAGLDDSKLAKKTYEEASKYLYDQEQEGSIELQKLDFQWDKYTKLIEMKEYIINTMSVPEKLFTIDKSTNIDLDKIKFTESLVNINTSTKNWTSANIAAYDTTFENLKKIIQMGSKDQVFIKKKNYSEDEQTSFKNKMEEIQKFWTNINDKIQNIVDKKIPYEETAFSSNYPTILLNIPTITKKQTQIFKDQKNATIEAYETKGEGAGQWLKELPSKYNGATTDKEAIDFLVYQQIQAAAFQRYSYKMDDTYTIQKAKSLVYKDIIGQWVTQDKKTWNLGDYASVSEDHQKDEDKIYFISTGSKIIDRVNLSGGFTSHKNGIFSEISDIINARHLVKLNNIVLDIKQDPKDYDANWKVSKVLLKSLFSSYGDGTNNKLAIEEMDDVYKTDGLTGKVKKDKEKADENLIGYFTSTTDSTRWKSGNLGYMTALKAVGMVPAYGVGMASVLHNLITSVQNPQSIDPKAVTVDHKLMNKIFAGTKAAPTGLMAGFIEAANVKTRFSSYISNAKTIDNKVFQEKADSVAKFIDSLTDDEVAKFFGKRIKNIFNSAASGTKDETGIAQITEVDSTNHIYLVVTPEYGIHIVKVTAGKQDLGKEINTQLQIAADGQDKSLMTTDFAQLFSDNYDKSHQMKSLLADNNFKKLLDKNITKEDTTNPETKSASWKASTDVEAMIDSQIKNSALTRINAIDPSKYIKYLLSAFDNDMVSTDLSVDPENLYKYIEELGGAK